MDDFQPFSAEPDAKRPKKRAARDGDQNGYEVDEPYEPKSSKFFLGCLVGCLGASLFFVVAIIGFAVAAVYWSQEVIEQAPEKIRARADSILDFDIPNGFEPVGGLNIEFPVVGRLGSFAFLSDQANRGILLLIDAGDQLTQVRSVEEWARELKNNIDPSFSDTLESLRDARTEEVTRDVRGDAVTFKITTGVRRKTREQRIIVSGSFPGRIGEAHLFLSTDAKSFSVADAKRLIRSIE